MQPPTTGPFHSNPSAVNCWKNHPQSYLLSPEVQDRQFVLFCFCFVFLPKSSTSDALATALHDWYGCLEDRKSVVMALFDLSKAFDRVLHSPLKLKLRVVGLSVPLHSWFRSYLSDRSQLVAVHGVNSPTFPFSLVFPRALSWAPTFSHLCE